MSFVNVFRFLLSVIFVIKSISAQRLMEDAFLTTPELIVKYKYPVETHKVVTDDGYILRHHRIPYGKNGPNVQKKPPILLQHGITDSSSTWIIKCPPNALGFLLADQGFDVWLMNNRGNKYSQDHTTLNSLHDSKRYWDFSYHELGIYDLPNTIDYILNLTQSSKLFHIGHSQGSTTLFVMLSEKPEYNNKIITHISYAPVGFVKHSISLLSRFFKPLEASGYLLALIRDVGTFNFAPANIMFHLLTSHACRDGAATQMFCVDIYCGLFGNNPSQLNKTMIPVIFGQAPSGASIMQAIHYSQCANSGKFRQFDYGSSENYKRYQSVNPPEYNIGNIKIPIYTFYGGKDALAHLTDVKKFHRLLPNLKEKNLIKDWAHLDFVVGIDAYEKVYVKTLQILKTFLK